MSDEISNDSKYRRYVQTMEKALQSFDIGEWADLISFLTRLLKVYSHPKLIARLFLRSHNIHIYHANYK